MSEREVLEREVFERELTVWNRWKEEYRSSLPKGARVAVSSDGRSRGTGPRCSEAIYKQVQSWGERGEVVEQGRPRTDVRKLTQRSATLASLKLSCDLNQDVGGG